MHPVANTLVQLQELLLIRDESKISSGTTKLDKLDKSVEAMSAELPRETCVCHDLTLSHAHTGITCV